MKNIFLKQTALSLFILSNTTLYSMYTGSDLQICKFLSAIHGDHEFITPCERPEASDLYLYQCIKAIGNNVANDIQMHFPIDVIGMIMSTIHELRKDLHAPCYKIYSFQSMPHIIISFIKDSLKKKRSHESIAHTVKTALHLSGKSVNELKGRNIFGCLALDIYNWHDRDPFHYLTNNGANPFHLDTAKILCLLTENKSWSMIIDDKSYISAFWSICKSFNVSVFDQLLSTAPNKEAVWKIVCTPTKYLFRIDDNGYVMLLNVIIANERRIAPVNREIDEATYHIICKLLACAPNKQEIQKLLTTPDPQKGNNALQVTKEENSNASYFINSDFFKSQLMSYKHPYYRKQADVLGKIKEYLNSYSQ